MPQFRIVFAAPRCKSIRRCARKDGLLFGRFSAGEAALQEFDLAVVVGLVFGDMKQFGVVLRGEVAVCDQRC